MVFYPTFNTFNTVADDNSGLVAKRGEDKPKPPEPEGEFEIPGLVDDNSGLIAKRKGEDKPKPGDDNPRLA